MNILQTRERDGGSQSARRTAPHRTNVLDVLLGPPLAELSIARGLINALDPIVGESAYLPSVELAERDGNYVIDVALPGFQPEDIAMELSGNELTISGSYKRRRDDAKTHYSEMQQASFTRTILLPQEVDADRVTANFENGMLHIVAPPKAPLTSKKISIGSSAEATKTRS